MIRSKKIRRTLHEVADENRTSQFMATNPSTGEILQCSHLVPLLQALARYLADFPHSPERSKWTIERTAE